MDVKLSKSSSVDPDQCFWGEAVHQNTHFIKTVRLYYEVGPSAYEQIGI